MKLYLFLIVAVIFVALTWGMTTLRHTTQEMRHSTGSVNQIIDEASR